MSIVLAPLFKDPIFDGAADPMIIQSHNDRNYYMFYTQRRANQVAIGVSRFYGTKIGVAISEDGANWHYIGALDLDFEFGHNTYWAPEIVYEEKEQKYHMYVSYIRGIYSDWLGKATIVHYSSYDLLHWEHLEPISIGSNRIIDPCIYRLSNGIWRMWYKDEEHFSHTCFADSHDLYSWVYKGEATNDCAQEGPNVFALGGYYWMIVDVWNGLGVYRSDDLLNFSRQKENILSDSGDRLEDVGQGCHADVVSDGEKAYIVYFTYPYQDGGRTAVQLAELNVKDGILYCDRNKNVDINWKESDFRF